MLFFSIYLRKTYRPGIFIGLCTTFRKKGPLERQKKKKHLMTPKHMKMPENMGKHVKHTQKKIFI